MDKSGNTGTELWKIYVNPAGKASCIHTGLMVLFAVVKSLIRFLAVGLSVCVSSLVAITALWVAYALVQSATLFSAPPFELLRAVIQGFSLSVLPAVFIMVLFMTVYYGRHQLSPLGSRVLMFVLAGGVLFGGIWLVSRQRAAGLAPIGVAPRGARVSAATLAERHGEVLDYGPSALVVFDGALVEASKDRALSWLPLESTATIELPGEPESVFGNILGAGEPLDALMRENRVIGDHFERVATSSLTDLAVCVLSLVFLLVSFQGLGVISPWPLANALMTMLILRLSLAGIVFLYTDPRVLALLSRFLPSLPPLWAPPAAIMLCAISFMGMNALLAVLRRSAHA